MIDGADRGCPITVQTQIAKFIRDVLATSELMQEIDQNGTAQVKGSRRYAKALRTTLVLLN